MSTGRLLVSFAQISIEQRARHMINAWENARDRALAQARASLRKTLKRASASRCLKLVSVIMFATKKGCQHAMAGCQCIDGATEIPNSISDLKKTDSQIVARHASYQWRGGTSFGVSCARIRCVEIKR